MFASLKRSARVWILAASVIVLGVMLFFVFRKPVKHLAFDWLRVGNTASMDKKAFYKDDRDVQSYYVLDSMSFFAVPSRFKATYVKCVVSLAYPKHQVEYENDIIFHREEIKKRIKHFLSQKTFHQLKSPEYRQRMKYSIRAKINEFLNYDVSDVYFIEFFVIQQDKF